MPSKPRRGKAKAKLNHKQYRPEKTGINSISSLVLNKVSLKMSICKIYQLARKLHKKVEETLQKFNQNSEANKNVILSQSQNAKQKNQLTRRTKLFKLPHSILSKRGRECKIVSCRQRIQSKLQLALKQKRLARMTVYFRKLSSRKYQTFLSNIEDSLSTRPFRFLLASFVSRSI